MKKLEQFQELLKKIREVELPDAGYEHSLICMTEAALIDLVNLKACDGPLTDNVENAIHGGYWNLSKETK